MTVTPKGAPTRWTMLKAALPRGVSAGLRLEKARVMTGSETAAVPKRTVYDYYGDKRSLLLAVAERSGQSLMESMRRGVAAHPSDEQQIGDIGQLETALIDFAHRIVTSTIEAPDTPPTSSW